MALTSGLDPAGRADRQRRQPVDRPATGDIDIVANSGAQGASWDRRSRLQHRLGANAFCEFPGGQAFIAGVRTLNQFVPMYNAWTVTAVQFQGIFLEASTINAFGYYATERQLVGQLQHDADGRRADRVPDPAIR